MMKACFWTVLLLFFACCNTKHFEQFHKLFEDQTDSARNILKYPICVTDHECLPPFGKCVAPICLRTCQHTILCAKNEYCNKTSGLCIPKLLRRRYTNACNEISHCLQDEFCLQNKCVRNVESCTKHENCQNDEFCSDAICLACPTREECRRHQACRLSQCYSSPPPCSSDCAAGEHCYLGKCVEKKCFRAEDCGGLAECVNGECVKVVCNGGADCQKDEGCLDGFCESIRFMVLKKFCNYDEHCLADEKCVEGKCSLSVKNVLPQNFICDCEDSEDCSLKSCSTPPGVKIENHETKSKGLKEIVKELLREEERNIVSEITKGKLSKNVNPTRRTATSRQPDDVIGRNKYDMETKTVYADSCSSKKHCSHGKCCIQGVCIRAKNCLSDIERGFIPVHDMKESGDQCENDKQCSSDESCDLGFCRPKRIFQRQVQCSMNSNCAPKQECLFGKCTGVVDLANEEELFPCYYYAENGTSYCEDEKRTCLMNACLLL